MRRELINKWQVTGLLEGLTLLEQFHLSNILDNTAATIDNKQRKSSAGMNYIFSVAARVFRECVNVDFSIETKSKKIQTFTVQVKELDQNDLYFLAIDYEVEKCRNITDDFINHLNSINKKVKLNRFKLRNNVFFDLEKTSIIMEYYIA